MAFRKKVSMDVSHELAYEACVGLLDESPHPGAFGIYVNQAVLFVFAAVLAMWFFTEGALSVIIGTFIFPTLVASLYPSYLLYLKHFWHFVTDYLVSEYRSARLRKAYLRNFYD